MELVKNGVSVEMIPSDIHPIDQRGCISLRIIGADTPKLPLVQNTGRKFGSRCMDPGFFSDATPFAVNNMKPYSARSKANGRKQLAAGFLNVGYHIDRAAVL